MPNKKKPKIDPVIDDGIISERLSPEPVLTDAIDTDKKVSVKTTKMAVGVKKSVIKTEVAASTPVTTKASASIDGANPTPGIGGLNLPDFSGEDASTFTGSRASTPIVKESTRRDSRFGKKQDTAVKHINDVISEQAYLDFETLPSLGRSSGPEGYNGTRRSKSSLIQKGSGGHVASPVFSRSIDIITRDNIVFTHGQDISTESARNVTDDRPDVGVSPVGQDTTVPNTELVRGNYVPRRLKVTINKDNVVTNFTFDVDNISTNLDDEQQAVLNNSAQHRKIHANRSEIYRQKMEDKAGDETSPNWSPLSRAIKRPTPTIAYLQDIENDLGSVFVTAYNKLSTALSFQINKAAKDGITVVRPRNEMMLSSIAQNVSSGAFDGKNVDPFTRPFYAAGSPSLFIAAFDTTAKYDTKGALLTLPKSFKSVLPVAEKHSNGFKVDKNFVKVLRNSQNGGTIGKEYDPTSPVYIDDFLSLVHPFDWNEQFKVTTSGGVTVVNEGKVGYRYGDYRNNYYTHVTNPLLAGIYDYLSRFASSYRSAFIKDKVTNDNFKDTDAITLEIPVTYSTTSITLWEILVLASTPYIQRRRLSSMREVIDYTINVEYPFEHLVDVTANLYGGSSSIGFSSIDDPLKFGKLDPRTALSFILPELFTLTDEGDDGLFMTLPFYFNEQEFTFHANGSWTYEGINQAFSYPISRSGIRIDYIDYIHSLDPKEFRLSYDRLTLPPLSSGDAGTARVYKYDAGTDGLVNMLVPSTLTVQDVLSLPRQLGYVMPSPYGYSSPNVKATSGLTTKDFLSLADNDNNTQIYRTSYKAFAYYGVGHSPVVFASTTKSYDTINNFDNVNHGSGANFAQDWILSPAGHDEGISVLNGVPLSLNAGFVDSTKTLLDDADATALTLINGISRFSPFVAGYKPVGVDPQSKVTTDDGTNMLSLANIIWARINMLQFALSPWDAKPAQVVSGEEDAPKWDAFDFMYMMNVCGFYASDYSESYETRIALMDESGLYFTEDPWVTESHLLR